MPIKNSGIHTHLRSAFSGPKRYDAPLAPTTTTIVNAQNVVTAANYTAVAMTADQPDYPRTLVITLTDADDSLTDGSIRITGYDAVGRRLVEIITGVTSTIGKTIETLNAFAWVEELAIKGFAGIDAGTDKISLGLGSGLGVPRYLEHQSDLIAVISGITDDLAAGGTLDRPRGVYTPNAAPDGSLNYLFLIRPGGYHTNFAEGLSDSYAHA